MDTWKVPCTITRTLSLSANYTCRHVIPSVILSLATTKIQVEFAFEGTTWHVAESWIGHQGAAQPWYFDGNQVQLKVSGAAAFDVNAAGILSDEVTFALDPTKNLVVSFFRDSPVTCPRADCGWLGFKRYYKTGNFASDTAPAGFVLSGSHNDYILYLARILGPAAYKFSGTVKEKGDPVSRQLRAIYRPTGVLFSTGSSGEDGAFDLDAPDDTSEMCVIALDDDAGEQYNDLIYGRVKGVLR